MSAVQTTCSSCGRLILQRTADRNEGLCRPCASAAARIPPPYFVLPEELTSYLISVGEDPADYVEMAWQHSPDFVVSYVEHIMEGRRLYRVWSPRLREFAHQCRREHPAPGGQAVSDLMRAKQGIFTEKIARASGISSNPYLVSICRMPLDAMPVAERLWAGENKNYVLLTQEEQEQWDTICPYERHAPRWFDRYWWDLDETPHLRTRRERRRWGFSYLPELEPGEEPWLVSEGFRSGPLSGGGHTELWAWNGTTCRYVS